ncbi:MAG: Phosphopantetheine attachment site [Micromonosporaceae bacterium]
MLDQRLHDLLRSHLPEVSARIELRDDETLVDLGIDSLRLVEFIIDLEDAFKISVPETEMLQTNFSTVASVSLMVDRILQGR